MSEKGSDETTEASQALESATADAATDTAAAAATTDAAGPTSTASRDRLTAIDVQQKEFRLAFRGYNERDVDEFLDRVTEELAATAEENRRLREQLEIGAAGAGAGAIAGAVTDTAAAQADAERILSDARMKAAEIVREAETRAATTGAAPEATSRAAIAPFLVMERDFLQTLGQLVQGHAESVKDMVRATREAEASARPSSRPPAVAPRREATTGDRVETPPWVPTAAPEPPPPATLTETPSDEAAAEVVEVVDVDDTADEPSAGGERSLRELFWGED